MILVKELPPVLITAMDSPGLSNSGAGDTSVSTGIRADGKAGVCKSAENDAMDYCCSAITTGVECMLIDVMGTGRLKFEA